MNKIYPTLLILLSYAALTAQEKTGTILGKHNGLIASHINPSYALRTESKWQLTLGGGHFFAQTNYGHITNTSTLDLARNYNAVEIPESQTDEGPTPVDRIAVFKEKGKSYADARAEIIGPSLLLKLNNTTCIGLYTRMRAMGSSYNIPEVANYDIAMNLVADSIYALDKARGAALVWGEAGFLYATALNEKVNVAATLKYLRGYGSAFAKNEMAFDFKEFDDENLDILSDGQFSVGFPKSDDGLATSGSGLGMDVGATIRDVWREGSLLGISIVDLGMIRINATSRTYGFTTEFELDGDNYNDITELAELEEQLDQDFQVLDSSDSYTMYLPTALSVQIAHPINVHLAIEGAWTHRIVPIKNGHYLARGNSINVTGVYERKHFSAFLPVTLFGYSDLRFGAAVRLGPLTIGSDHIMSLLGRRDFNGTDLYAMLQVYPFKLGMPKRKKKNGKGNINCYW